MFSFSEGLTLSTMCVVCILSCFSKFLPFGVRVDVVMVSVRLVQGFEY